MNPKLKPIEYLLIISMALHAAAVFIAILLIIFFRRPVWPLFAGINDYGETFFISLPITLLMPLFISLIFHCVISIAFIKMIQPKNIRIQHLEILSILFIIFSVIISPIVNYIWGQIRFRLMNANLSIDAWLEYIIIRNRIMITYIIQGISVGILIIAVVMIWYFCYIEKTKQKQLYIHADVPNE